MERVNNINENEIIKCRYCSSTNIIIGKKGFSISQAAFGAITWGVLGGIIGGLYGSKDTEFMCVACGYKWYPFNAIYKEVYEKEDMEKRNEELKRQKEENKIEKVRKIAVRKIEKDNDIVRKRVIEQMNKVDRVIEERKKEVLMEERT